VGAFEAYDENRSCLVDPAVLQRLVSASGVPCLRITIDPQSAGTTNTFAQEARARQLLREGGPDNASLRGVRWCPINDIDTWVSSVEEVEALQQDPAAFFETRGYIVEPYLGEFFMLCWATRASSLTVDDGDWAVARAFQTVDQLGRPAVGFQMDPRGAKLLGTLTAANLNNQMAVLLDEEVYTAPNLRGAISSQGVIEGRFSLEEINYIIRVLSAGSLSARLSPEPLSVNTVAPDFGQDNLDQGRTAGMWALALVSGFMVAYYFAFGVVAVASLLFNAAIILGAVALARASFTLPGIAGVILTFGMAVDANVLIYERIREETRKGADLRAAARLGYQKALSAIVDGNVTNLIVCFVLGTLGTPEIKGFAITLGIGVIGTMISALVFTRLLLNFFIEVLGWKKLGMLPTSIPVLERILEPKINWIGFRYFAIPISIGLVALGIGLTVRQGEEMLDTEFRGGTAATLDLKDESGEPITLTRQNVEDRIDDFAA
ncbi:MAG: protein translocase subunit SecD, partial [Planctomycetota bacterium]